MTGVKSFFASRTIWGAGIAILGSALPLFGLSFTPEDGTELLSLIDEAMQIGGSLLAMYGRVVASTRIGKAE